MTRRRVAIAGVAAISRFGANARGLGNALRERAVLPGLPAESALANPKARNARKMMSRGAYLAAAALADVMTEVGWTAEQREDAGYYLGVGASGGSLDDVSALLDASLQPTFSLPAFGEQGLAACNPLLAFQLMNNFALAHGAIFESLGGPNGALFSRGSGTTAALIEAVHAIRCGDCDRAVAGGADSATHDVTRAELVREGFVARGLIPSEGAAVLALALAATDLSTATSTTIPTSLEGRSSVLVEGAAIASGHGRAFAAALDDATTRALAEAGLHDGVGAGDLMDIVVIAPWGPPVIDASLSALRGRFPSAAIVDTSALGATLAAGPALAWIAAFDLLQPGQRAIVIDAGVDGDVGAVVLHAGGRG